MTTTSIEWTEKTWNPVRGCSVVSPGCVNCYAMKQAHRFSSEGQPYHGLTKLTKAGPQWTGVVRTVEDVLLAPLSWRKSGRVFVNSMSDLFHEDVPDDFIDRVFAVMALAYQHTFQVLTKRPERMRAYVDLACGRIADTIIQFRRERGDTSVVVPLPHLEPGVEWWPLPNVWLGVSAENQETADARIPLLLQTPAAVRWVSAEPLLGPVDLTDVVVRREGEHHINALSMDDDNPADDAEYGGACLDWVIVGGESGPKARPCDVAWIRSIVLQCKAAEVPVFVKQLGAVPVMSEAEWRAASTTAMLNHRNDKLAPAGSGFVPLLVSSKGGDPAEWPEDLRVREWPEVRA